MRNVVWVRAIVAAAAAGLLLGAAPNAPAHRIDVSAAKKIASLRGSGGGSSWILRSSTCSRQSDHRARCSGTEAFSARAGLRPEALATEHDQTARLADMGGYEQDFEYDLVLVGSRLYVCEDGECSRLEMFSSLSGRTRHGDPASVDLGFVARDNTWRARRLVWVEFPGLRLRCSDGSVRRSNGGTYSHSYGARSRVGVDGRIDARHREPIFEASGSERDRLTGTLRRGRLTGIMKVTQQLNFPSRTCSASERFSLRQSQALPRYIAR